MRSLAVSTCIDLSLPQVDRGAALRLGAPVGHVTSSDVTAGRVADGQ